MWNLPGGRGPVRIASLVSSRRRLDAASRRARTPPRRPSPRRSIGSPVGRPALSRARHRRADERYLRSTNACRIWPERMDGRWLYVEQAQRRHRPPVPAAHPRPRSTTRAARVEVFVPDRHDAGSAWRTPEAVDAVDLALLLPREGCPSFWTRRPTSSRGTRGRAAKAPCPALVRDERGDHRRHDDLFLVRELRRSWGTRPGEPPQGRTCSCDVAERICLGVPADDE